MSEKEFLARLPNLTAETEAECKLIYYFCMNGNDYCKEKELRFLRLMNAAAAKQYLKWREHYDAEQREAIKGAAKTMIRKADADQIRTTTENGVIKPTKEPMLVCLADIEKKSVEWLIPNYIPKGMITLIAGDGGTGKGFTACNIVAGLTTGKKTLFDENINPFESKAITGTCLYLSYEDDASHVLVDRLEKAGADLKKVLTLNLSDAEPVYFDSPIFEKWIAEYKPILIICDPLQSFLPAGVNMSARNMMRQAMTPLARLGEKYGVTFLILMHTNKKTNAWGRNRLADSADVWDIARSVFICGFTNDGDMRYLSHEKNTHAEWQKTILFHIEDGRAVFDELSDKRDREFIIENGILTRPSPQREEAKERILQKLQDGQGYEVRELEDCMKAIGISHATFRRAKEELISEGKLKSWRAGFGGKWFISIITEREFFSEQV